MKNVSLLQCAFDAFANRDKEFFAKYETAIRELTDASGSLILDLMLENIDREISDATFLDILNQHFDPQTVTEILYLRSMGDIDVLIPRLRHQEYERAIEKLTRKVVTGEIRLIDAVKAIKPEPEIESGEIGITARELMTKKNGEIKWIADNYLPVGTLNVIAGTPKSGKSLLCLDLCTCLATGQDLWLNRIKLSPCRVVYLDAENAEILIESRLKYIGAELTDNLIMITKQSMGVGRIDLTDSKTHSRIKSYLASKGLTENDLVIIDSFRRVFSGNENDSQEVSRAMAAIQELTPATKLIIHHLRKQGNVEVDIAERTRGSGDITAAVDGLITIETQGTEYQETVLKLALARWTGGIKPVTIAWKKTLTSLSFQIMNYNEIASKQLQEMERVKRFLQTRGSGSTIFEIMNGTGLTRDACDRVLSFAKAKGAIESRKVDKKTYYALKTIGA